MRRLSAVGAAGALMMLAGAATADAAPTFKCEASALRASVLGQAPVEPVTTGRTGDCKTAQATPALAVPQLLNAQALIASTAFDGGKGTAQATGGVAQLAAVPTPDFVAQLPTKQFIDNLQNVTVPLPAPVGPVQVNIKDAVAALVPLPGTPLVSADVLTSTVAASCQNGRPVLSGSSRLAGVKLLGNEVGVNGVVEQSLAVMDSQSIDMSKLDLSKVSIITPLDPVTHALAQSLLGPALAQLPPIQIPASVLQFKLTPSEQIREGDALTQRALHAQISLLGQPVLDAVFGEAKVSAAANTCGAPAGGVADQVLQCTDRKLVLVDVLERGRRVKLLGAANRDYVGRRVAIRLRATGKVVAHAKVRKDGSFETTAPAPPRAFLATHRRANRVRYRAEIGKEKSLPLKLRRRLVVSSMTSKKGKVTIAGRVVGPLTTPVSTVRVVRRVSCHKVVLVKRFKPRPDGTFRVTVKAPKHQAAAVYRLVTRVREKPSNPRTYPTFTLPRGVALNTR